MIYIISIIIISTYTYVLFAKTKISQNFTYLIY